MTSALTHTLNTLSPGKEYSFKVSASNSVGEGEPSECVTARIETTVPDAPTQVRAQMQGKSILVSWQEPASSGGDPITGYTLYAYENSNACAGTESELMTSALTHTLNTLSPGKEYSFKVSASNSVGEGEPSECVTARIEMTVPDAPTQVTAQAQENSILVSWQQPFNGGDPILEYVLYQYDTAECSETPNEIITSSTTYMIDTLFLGMQFSFKVSAINSLGESQPSKCLSSSDLVQAREPSLIENTQASFRYDYEISHSGIPAPYISVDWGVPLKNSQIFIIAFYTDASCQTLNQRIQKRTPAHTFRDLEFDTLYSLRIILQNPVEEIYRSKCVSITIPAPQCGDLDLETEGLYPRCRRIGCGIYGSSTSPTPTCIGRSQDLNLTSVSSLLGRDSFFQKLVNKDRVDASPSLSVWIFDEELSTPEKRQGDRILSAFCYHKPGNCGQDSDGNNLFSPESAQAIGVNVVDFSSITNALAYPELPDNAIVAVPADHNTLTVEDIAQGPFLLLGADSLNPFQDDHSELLKTLGNFDRHISLPDQSVQRVPAFIFVSGYVVENQTIVPASDSAECGAFQDYCIVAPYQAYADRGAFSSTAAVSATLYAASQLWPMMTAEQILALFFSCLTYPAAREDHPRQVWGLGIPNLECMAQPQGDLRLRGSERKFQNLSGTPLANTYLQVDGLRYGRTFRIAGPSQAFAFSGLNLETNLFRPMSVVPLFQETLPPFAIQILARKDGLPRGLSARWKDILSIAVVYQTSPSYFGTSPGTRDFDPGDVKEITFATALRKTFSNSTTVITEFTVKNAAAKSALVSLRGRALGSAVQIETSLNKNTLISMGISYSLIQTRYRVAEIEVPVPQQIHTGLSLNLVLANKSTLQFRGSYTQPLNTMTLQSEISFPF